jgi:hypothetical protein
MIHDQKLDFWIKNQYNVLMTGKHGVGKTSLILEAFNRHNLKWVYFSAATMDPWVDLIGVPKEKIDANGNTYLDLVRPKAFQDNEVEAIFMDEFKKWREASAARSFAKKHPATWARFQAQRQQILNEIASNLPV